MKRLGIAAVVFGLFGCDDTIGVIDRTQPNAIDKRMFDGVWYHRATIVEADPESGMNEGISSNMEKLRWDIQEDLLIGYRSYEFVPFGEGLTDEGRDFFGSPVVAFRIESHFDIIRDYNTVTGVPGNVVVENTTDRPWHQRRYIRVDWSQNVAGNATLFGFGSLHGMLSGFANSAYYVQGNEPENPDRPFITNDYFDVTNMYAMSPSTFYCLSQLVFQSVPRCGTANVKTRLSFRRVDPTDDYEALYYPDRREYTDDEGSPILFDNDERPCLDIDDPDGCFVRGYPMDAQFGNFRTLRVAFDRERFLTRSGRIYLAGRFDLWEQTFDDTGTLIPYGDRQVKPIVYYNRPTMPENMHRVSMQMAANWAEPFNETAAFLQGYTENDEGKRPDVNSFLAANADRLAHPEADADIGALPGMFQVRRNDCSRDNVVRYADEKGLTPVIDRVAGGVESITDGNIENVCAAIQWEQLQNGATLDPKVAERDGRELAFQWQRMGDLRYNINNYVRQLQPFGPWGVAQFGQDPETGEYVANIANYFSDAGDFIAQRSVDHVQFINGDLDPQDLLRGNVVRDTVVSRRTAAYGIRDDVKAAMSQDSKAAMARQGVSPIPTGGSAGGAGDSGRSVGAGAPITDADSYASMFAGTQLEREYLITSDMLRAVTGPTVSLPVDGTPDPSGGSAQNPAYAQYAGLMGAFMGLKGEGLPGAPVGQPTGIPEEAYMAASPVNWAFNLENNPYEVIVREFGSAGYDLADFFDPNVSGIADELKGESREDIFDFMQENLYLAVQGHEVGHTVGLRHNFEASMDPLNYRPEFWERYWNNPSRPGAPNRGNEYKYASIMDYGFDFAIEGWHGLGTYDKAAIRFMYGQLREVWDTSKVNIPDARRYGRYADLCGVFNRDSFSSTQNLIRTNLAPEDLVRLYAQVPNPGCEDLPADYDFDADPLNCDSPIDRQVREFAAKHELTADQLGFDNICSPFDGFDDYNELWDAVQDYGTEASPGDITVGASNIVEGRMLMPVAQIIQQDLELYDQRENFDFSQVIHEVPFAYCSDRFAGFSDPSCQRWDNGWDFTESVQAGIFKYDRDYIFDHFQMDRSSWNGMNPFLYVNRLLIRRFKVMGDVYRYFLFQSSSTLDSPRYDDWEESAFVALNFLERVLQEPEPGTYCLDEAANTYRLQGPNSPPCTTQTHEVGLGYGEGRYLNDKWNEEFYFNTTVMGQFWDKLASLFMLTRSRGFFAFSLDQFFDRRAFALPYLRTFQDPILQRFSALIRNDHEGYSPRVVPEDPSDPNSPRMVRYEPFFDEQFGPEAPDEFVGESVREWLRCGNPSADPDDTFCNGNGGGYPTIEPAWSYTLRLYGLAFALSNWSTTADFSIDYHRLTNVTLPGSPGDYDLNEVEEVFFVDPETQLEYRAPSVEPFTINSFLPLIRRSYYGNRADKEVGKFHEWSVGAELLRDLETLTEQEYEPALQACQDADPFTDPSLSTAPECIEFEAVRRELADQVGMINVLRKFTERAEGVFR